jgi:TonB-linked SusC/RagA family outer membrane protein
LKKIITSPKQLAIMKENYGHGLKRVCLQLLLLCLFSFSFAAAQAQKITGTVSDESGKKLSAVSVTVKGTTTGVTTDANGQYQINANGNATLEFSSVGFTAMSVPVSGRSVVDVVLLTDAQSMDVVVVTALGIKKESKKLGYSATSVKTDELVTNRTTNVMESLEGKVAGLNITPPAAGAGASTQIRLRGQVGFAGGNNSPLIVINGLPIDQGARSADGAGQQRDRGDNLMNINPDDVESMTILKGSTASALYGSRAAAGAIIITTKSGSKNQGIGIEYSSSYTSQHALNFMDQFQTMYGQGTGGLKPTSAANAKGSGQFGFGARLDGSLTPIFDGTLQPYIAYEDRLFDYLQTGANFTNTVALSGGGANGSFRVSFSNTDAKGIEPRNEYKRKIANVGINHNITKKLKLSVNINWANEEQINPPQVGTQGAGSVNFYTRLAISIPGSQLKSSAIDPATGTENQTSGFQGTVLNPNYANQIGQNWVNKRDRILGTATLRYDFTDWLYVQGRYNYDYSVDYTESKVPGGIGTSLATNADGTYKGSYSVSNGKGTDINADYLIGGSHKFGKFSVDASFGGNTWRVENRNTDVSANNFILRDFYSIPNGNVKNQGVGYSQFRVNSLYGTAEFGYNGLFYVNVTGRTDWFSVYNPESNRVFYPSISGSFIFSELTKRVKWLNYGKLRASWAKTGSAQGVNVYEGLLTYNIAQNNFNGQVTSSIGTGTSPNPNLTPFSLEEQEIGLELRMFKNRLNIDIAGFNKVTTRQVLNVTLSNTSGYTGSKDNLASLRNRGLETMIEGRPIETKNFSWTSSWNNTYLATKVLAISPGVSDFLLLNFNSTGNEFLGQIRYTVGLPMNQLYTRTYERNAKGEIVVNSNGRLRATADYAPVGSSIPKYTGGWTNSFNYKNLTLGIFIDYKFGGTVLSSTALNMLRSGMSKASLVGRRDGETGINNTNFPSVFQNGSPNTANVTDLQGFYADYRNLQIGDPFIFKSDFVKLRNVSLAYNFTNIIKKASYLKFVKGLSMSASVRNVAILYKDLPGLDPEAIQSSGDVRAGYENSSLPTTRNYNISLNIKF